MCSTPSIPNASNNQSQKQETIATPTYADASVTKAGAKTRQKTAGLAGRDIKTSLRGLGDDAVAPRKDVLGQ